MGDNSTEIVSLLTQFGFNDTEALAYHALLRSGTGLTGYGVAKAIGKAPPNAYLALTSLAKKGAVIVDQADTRSYRALPPEELLSRLRQQFAERSEALEQQLSRIKAPENDSGIYQLQTANQVFDRARSMLERAQETVLFELFPGSFGQLAPELSKVAKAGTPTVGLVLDEKCKAEAVRTIVSKASKRVQDIWSVEQLILIIDARELLVAYLKPDLTFLHGIWTANPYLAFPFHNGIVSDVVLHDQDIVATIGSPNGALFGIIPSAFERIAAPEKDS
jgi:HTH-type transcriptional regulator, sugar sensing transcriptional regulator